MRHILDHPEMAAMVGLPTKVVYQPGELYVAPSSYIVTNTFLGTLIHYPLRKPGEETPERKFVWAESLAGLTQSVRFPSSAFNSHRTAKGLIACTGDKISVGQNVILRHEGVREHCLFWCDLMLIIF